MTVSGKIVRKRKGVELQDHQRKIKMQVVQELHVKQ